MLKTSTRVCDDRNREIRRDQDALRDPRRFALRGKFARVALCAFLARPRGRTTEATTDDDVARSVRTADGLTAIWHDEPDLIRARRERPYRRSLLACARDKEGKGEREEKGERERERNREETSERRIGDECMLHSARLPIGIGRWLATATHDATGRYTRINGKRCI